ncbi:MAG TPA: hypothetical protein VJ904_05620, partial [Tichowtungia sp.]|nr:hypothetical protein [Tichowtungia sp.]
MDVTIQVTPEYRFRLINAHLKSKVYSPLGQTEMRRNEARLLTKPCAAFWMRPRISTCWWPGI